MATEDLYNLVKDYLGYKISNLYINSEKNAVCGLLYDSFWLECSTNYRYGSFGAGICCGNGYIITEFCGKRRLLNSDEESIKRDLQVIDEYCRLRLPDKFLEAYDKAYFFSLYEDGDY